MKKDNSIIREIYEHYHTMMYTLAIGIANDRYAAEDIVQNSMIKIMHIEKRFKKSDIGTKRCYNLIYTVTKNSAIDYLRQESNQQQYNDMSDLSGMQKSAEDVYFELVEFIELVDAIRDLDDIYKDIVRLKLIHHLSNKEIADIMNISVNTVYRRLAKTNSMLVKKVRGNEKR